nr:ATP-binding protein [Bacteroidota bacterium]
MNESAIRPIDPGKLDLSMEENEFVIYYDNNPLLTSGGKPVAHSDSRLIKHLLLKLTLNRDIRHQEINSYSLFSFMKDYIEQGEDLIGRELQQLIKLDELLGKKSGKDQILPSINPEQALEYFEKNQYVLNLIYWGATVINESLRDFVSGLEVDSKTLKDLNISDVFISKLEQYYASLSPEKKAVVNMLTISHNCGVVLPLMLVSSKVSPSEYANAVVALHLKKTERPVFEFGEKWNKGILKLNFEEPENCIKMVYDHASRANEFLGFFEKSRKKITVIREKINQGEGDQIEFKSTFRWDLRQNKKNPAIEHAALKTMAAFLNSDGGDLLIGVEDDGNIIGIEADGFVNDDKFLLHVWALIKSSMGQEISPYIKTTLEKFNGKTVCRVNCAKSPKPIFLRQKGFDEALFIRSGPGTVSLEISEALKYIQAHFN